MWILVSLLWLWTQARYQASPNSISSSWEIPTLSGAHSVFFPVSPLEGKGVKHWSCQLCRVKSLCGEGSKELCAPTLPFLFWSQRRSHLTVRSPPHHHHQGDRIGVVVKAPAQSGWASPGLWPSMCWRWGWVGGHWRLELGFRSASGQEIYKITMAGVCGMSRAVSQTCLYFRITLGSLEKMQWVGLSPDTSWVNIRGVGSKH